MLNAIKTTLSNLRRSDEGATLVEYGIALLIAVTVGTAALIPLANNVKANFEAADTAMTTR